MLLFKNLHFVRIYSLCVKIIFLIILNFVIKSYFSNRHTYYARIIIILIPLVYKFIDLFFFFNLSEYIFLV